MTTLAGVWAPGKARWIDSYVLTIGSDFGRSVKLGSCVCSVSAGSASASSAPPESTAESDRPAQDAVEHEAPDARLAGPLRRREERDPSLVDAVAELREQRRQDRERADQRDRDHQHRADGDRREDGVAGEEHPGHRDQHGQAGDEDRVARRAGSLQQRLAAATAPRARSSRSRRR